MGHHFIYTWSHTNVNKHYFLYDFIDPEMAELKKAHKQAVKEEKRERRKNKIPKHMKKRKEKVIKQRHGK